MTFFYGTLKSLSSRKWPYLALAALVLVGLIVAGRKYLFPINYRCTDCNIILISIDTLRADHLGSYGYARKTSPNIDVFAKQTAFFEWPISQAPSTAPSHGSMLTGTIPSTHRALFSQKSRLSEAVKPLAEILRDHGYRTASFNGGGQVSAQFGFDRGFDNYQSFERNDYENERFRDRIKEGIDWMDRHKNEKFFLFLHTFEVHIPYAPEAADLALFQHSYSGQIPNAVPAM